MQSDVTTQKNNRPKSGKLFSSINIAQTRDKFNFIIMKEPLESQAALMYTHIRKAIRV